jgi:glutaredoxin 2
MKLYQYLHCPYCIRVRLALGLLKIPYQSIVVPYHDEETPIKLTGKKMLPIFDFGNGEILNESLDIIKKLDVENILKNELDHTALNIILDKLAVNIHNICMPLWIWTPEFSIDSRHYFEAKKSKKRGPFSELIKHREEFLTSLKIDLLALEKELNPFYHSQTLTIQDLMIAAQLWGMNILPDFSFSPALLNYLGSFNDINIDAKIV